MKKQQQQQRRTRKEKTPVITINDQIQAAALKVGRASIQNKATGEALEEIYRLVEGVLDDYEIFERGCNFDHWMRCCQESEAALEAWIVFPLHAWHVGEHIGVAVALSYLAPYVSERRFRSHVIKLCRKAYQLSMQEQEAA